MNKTLILVLVTFLNLWIWRIFQSNLLIFLVIVATVWFLYLEINQKLNFKFKIIIGGVFISLIFLQWKTTPPASLVLLDNDEQRVQQQRLQFYNPSSHYLRVLFYRLDLKNFLEGDFNTISTRLQRNFFETIDPNVYFFGGHPRERVWAADFEKFPFILMIPFLIGLSQIVLEKNILVFIYGLVCLMILSLIGHKNNLGPFILFPLFVICIWVGLQKIYQYLKKKHET